MFAYILRNCCNAILPILYKAQDPAAKTGVNTIKSLISIYVNSLNKLMHKLYYNDNPCYNLDFNTDIELYY